MMFSQGMLRDMLHVCVYECVHGVYQDQPKNQDFIDGEEKKKHPQLQIIKQRQSQVCMYVNIKLEKSTTSG